jgi:hypothetical protein
MNVYNFYLETHDEIFSECKLFQDQNNLRHELASTSAFYSGSIVELKWRVLKWPIAT